MPASNRRLIKTTEATGWEIVFKDGDGTSFEPLAAWGHYHEGRETFVSPMFWGRDGQGLVFADSEPNFIEVRPVRAGA